MIKNLLRGFSRKKLKLLPLNLTVGELEMLCHGIIKLIYKDTPGCGEYLLYDCETGEHICSFRFYEYIGAEFMMLSKVPNMPEFSELMVGLGLTTTQHTTLFDMFGDALQQITPMSNYFKVWNGSDFVGLISSDLKIIIPPFATSIKVSDGGHSVDAIIKGVSTNVQLFNIESKYIAPLNMNYSEFRERVTRLGCEVNLGQVVLDDLTICEIKDSGFQYTLSNILWNHSTSRIFKSLAGKDSDALVDGIVDLFCEPLNMGEFKNYFKYRSGMEYGLMDKKGKILNDKTYGEFGVFNDSLYGINSNGSKDLLEQSAINIFKESAVFKNE